MYPFLCNSRNFYFNSFNSLAAIRYGLFVIGAVLGIRSIINSKSLSGGILGKSSGNTSGYSHTIGTSSMLAVCILQTIGSALGA